MTKVLEIYLSNGGYIPLEETEENKNQLVNAIDEGLPWVTIGGKTINLNHVTCFGSSVQDAQKGTDIL